jgi:hypothetical protein
MYNLLILLQRVFSCMVHVKPRNKFCDHWTTCTCQSFEVIYLFFSRIRGKVIYLIMDILYHIIIHSISCFVGLLHLVF